MAYNKENFRRIAEEFSSKRVRAEERADTRRFEVECAIPELHDIHVRLAESGMEIFAAAVSGEDADIALARVKAENDALRTRKRELLIAAGYPEDYTEPRYDCALCHDTGYASGSMCRCLKEALTLAGIESAGLGRLVKDQSFDSFSLEFYKGKDLDTAARNLFALKEFANSFSGKNDGNFLLLGPTGLGKTHLSSSVAAVLIERGFDVAYTTSGNLFSVFERQRFGNGNPGDGTDSPFFDAELLIIDDLGTEITNQFTLSCLYSVLNSRLVSGKSTLINTNLSPEELRHRYADRITSRLFGEFRPLLFSGRDIRAQKAGM